MAAGTYEWREGVWPNRCSCDCVLAVGKIRVAGAAFFWYLQAQSRNLGMSGQLTTTYMLCWCRLLLHQAWWLAKGT
jgi:hypothetical protein